MTASDQTETKNEMTLGDCILKIHAAKLREKVKSGELGTYAAEEADRITAIADNTPSNPMTTTLNQSKTEIMKTELKSRDGSIWVELDASEIYPQDPGQGTPVLVCLKTGETASWTCATMEGECDGVPLTNDQKEWLENITEEVETWMEEKGC